jgi:hypothetical protein
MPLEDYLMPGEQIKLHSNVDIEYSGKDYELILTDKRILLYAKRGLLGRKDDVVTQKLDELQGVKYKEKGLIKKEGEIEIQGKTIMPLTGPPAAVKSLYQQLMQFM